MAGRFPKTVAGILDAQLEFGKRKETNLHTFIDHFMNKYDSTGLYPLISKISFGHLGRFPHQVLFNEMIHLACNYEKPPVEFPVDCLVGKYSRPVLYYVAGWMLYSASKVLTVAKDKRPIYYKFSAMQSIMESEAKMMGLPTSLLERRKQKSLVYCTQQYFESICFVESVFLSNLSLKMMLTYKDGNIIAIDRNCDVLPIYYDPLIVMFVSIQYLMLNKIVRARLF